jgi:FeS assembly SUF system regulator
MLRLSKLTDYATVILSYMANDYTSLRAAVELAEATGIALPTVAKILKLLVNARIVTSVRGAKGGYILVRAPEKITVAAIINALEGPIAITECSISAQNCGQSEGCKIRANWGLINQTIYKALEAVTLADMILPTTLPLVPLGVKEVHIPVAQLFR